MNIRTILAVCVLALSLAACIGGPEDIYEDGTGEELMACGAGCEGDVCWVDKDGLKNMGTKQANGTCKLNDDKCYDEDGNVKNCTGTPVTRARFNGAAQSAGSAQQ